MQRKLIMNLKDRNYPIFFGEGLLDQLGRLIRQHLSKARRVFVISNTSVDALYGARVMKSLEEAELNPAKGLIPDGEQHKTLETASKLYDQLVEHQMDRSSVVISLGGGVVGDIAGFVAATFMRGVPFVQVPTSLLAQVDSSIGGKVAVNHPAGKNLIGAFHQPGLVLIDIDTLKTLPAKEMTAGMAEVIKHGVIMDHNYFNWIEGNLERILEMQPKVLEEMVYGSCFIKGKVVEQDEREENLRAILNFGHTVGHALEAISHYQRYRHGEAVAIGMVQACRLGQAMGMMGQAEVERVILLLEKTGLPTTIPQEFGTGEILEAMKRDKKAYENQIKMVIPAGIGRVQITDQWDEEKLIQVLDDRE